MAKKETTKTEVAKKVKKKTAKKKIVKAAKVFDYNKKQAYPLTEALALVKKFSHAKFDAAVEVHLRLSIDPRQGSEQVRSTVSLPHGTGKSVKVAAFVSPDLQDACRAAGADIVGGEELINQIKQSEKTDFQVAVADPAMMKNLAKIAKILGTRGLMPSPKNDTVSPNPAKAVAELKKGKVSFKNDDTGNLHVAIGKVSFSDSQLAENFTALLEAVKKVRPASAKGTYLKGISICSTMGPGIKVAV